MLRFHEEQSGVRDVNDVDSFLSFLQKMDDDCVMGTVMKITVELVFGFCLQR